MRCYVVVPALLGATVVAALAPWPWSPLAALAGAGLALAVAAPWAHLAAILVLALTWLGACPGACSGLAPYDHMLQLPTALLGAIGHALAAGAWFWGHRWRDLPLAALAGVSLFYGLILLDRGHWCGACVAVHGLVGSRLGLALWRAAPSLDAMLLRLLLVLAAAGGVNAIYHRRPPPPPPVEDVRDLLPLLPLEEPPGPSLETPGDAGGEADARPAGPVLATAGRWGAGDAGRTLWVNIDADCDHCRDCLLVIRERLAPAVAGGEVAVVFVLTYSGQRSRAAATLAYAAGLEGDQAWMLRVLDAAFALVPEVERVSDLFRRLPAACDRPGLVARVRARSGDLTGLLQQAVDLVETRGLERTPGLWLEGVEAEDAGPMTGPIGCRRMLDRLVPEAASQP